MLFTQRLKVSVIVHILHRLNVLVIYDENYRGGLLGIMCNDSFNNRVIITSL